MTLPAAAQQHPVSRLRDALAPADGEPRPADSLASAAAAAPAPFAGAAAARALAGRVRRGAKARAVRAVVRVVQAATREERALLGDAQSRLAAIEARLEDVAGRVGALSNESAIAGAEVNRINIELLKGEFRSLLSSVEELGMAFAPATGWAGAGARFAELREQVNAVERRLRESEAVRSAPTAAAPAPSAPAERDGGGPRSELFNYVAFERRFRGDADEVAQTLVGRYAELLAQHSPVVDIGCGRAELLAELAARGVDCVGVDTDSGMVADARARGLRIEHTDALSYLRAAAPHSIGAVFSAHVAEHLMLDDLLEFIDLARQKLKPGGVFIAETPNPASLVVLGNSYILDPTHVWPLHPSLFAFLCETAGYRDVRLAMHSPASDYHLLPVEAEDGPEFAQRLAAQVNEQFERLNAVLFGPQEYAVIATTAPSGDGA